MALPTTPKEPNPGPSERRTKQHLQSMEQRLGYHITEGISKVSRSFGSMQAALSQQLQEHRTAVTNTLNEQLEGVKSRNGRLRTTIRFTMLFSLINLILLAVLLARVY